MRCDDAWRSFGSTRHEPDIPVDAFCKESAVMGQHEEAVSLPDDDALIAELSAFRYELPDDTHGRVPRTPTRCR